MMSSLGDLFAHVVHKFQLQHMIAIRHYFVLIKANDQHMVNADNNHNTISGPHHHV